MNRKTFLKLTPLAFLAGLLARTTPAQAAPVRPKVWTAKITQNLTNDPNVTVIANDYSFDLTVTRDAAGIYTISSPQPIFVEGKVFPTLTMGDAFVLTRLPKIFQFANDTTLLKLFVVDANGTYSDGWITYVKLEVYP